MKTNSSHRIRLAALGFLAALALPLSAETVQPSSVDRGHNRPNTNPRVYDPDRPLDRDNKQVRNDTKGMPSTEFTRGDHRLVKKIAGNSAYETALSRQATTRAANADVRTFADTLVRDHEAMTSELTTLVTSRGAMLPPGDRYRDNLDDLAQKTGSDYDEAYLDDMIDSHEDAVDLLEKAAESENAELAAFATKHLPTVRDHLARAKQLDEVVDD